MKKNEYPNPQFFRENTEFLNGVWSLYVPREFGEERYEMVVPFCVESELSRVAIRERITRCRYERTFIVENLLETERLVLHFGAVDYQAKVFINNRFVGIHRGGFTPFSFEITEFVGRGENLLTVEVYDNVLDNVPSGKQCYEEQPHGCFYTRVTGIWQSVWLERTPKEYIKSVKFVANIKEKSVFVSLEASALGEVRMTVAYNGRTVGEYVGELVYKDKIEISLSELHLWETGKGELYDVTIRFGEDEVQSYFGMREVAYSGYRFLVNGKSVFQRFVLDQGYYPRGIYTPENDEGLERDIRLAMELGFNGPRLHQKVFDPRFLYHCDRLGYMVWGEFPSWGCVYDSLDCLGPLVGEWAAVVDRDFNHPSIVVWCPLNEVWGDLGDMRKGRDVRLVESLYAVTKQLDPTRPCVDVSGGYHGTRTDVFDFHCYHNSEALKESLRALVEEDKLTMDKTYAENEDIRYAVGLPVCASEYGGMAYSIKKGGWGYRVSTDEQAFADEYVELTSLLLACPKISGFCYTQLYDVEQEQNGLYTYQRTRKFSEEVLRRLTECNRQTAAVENDVENI